nr:protein heat intolerant 4 [Tanacetum cinerariifolium]
MRKSIDIARIRTPAVVCEFDREMDELEEFTNELIASEKLTEDQKDKCKEFVKEKVREAKRANQEAREKRIKARRSE